MAKTLDSTFDQNLEKKSETFIKKMNSDMHFKSEMNGSSMSFDWIDEIEFSCPYIDNAVRNPKLALINEEEVVKIEKAKKITVSSVKDLSRHTHFIEEVDPVTDDVRPSKILIVRPEETLNIYENRFIYTLINNFTKFLIKKEEELENFEMKNNKTLEYASSTTTTGERINIELKITSTELPKDVDEDELEKELDSIKKRIGKIKQYLASWRNSELIKTLDKANVPPVLPPIKKTNVILKNPNFQVAMKLWGFLQTYDDKDNNNGKQNIDTEGNNLLKGVLDDSFLMDYFVLDSISTSKREQKTKLARYAIVMIRQQIKRAVSLLLSSGIEITDKEILDMVSCELANERDKRIVDSSDVKKKFQSALDEYLERIQNYL